MELARESTTELLADLVKDARDLATVHIQGAKKEVSQELDELKNAAYRTAVIIAVAMVGSILLGMGLAMGLSAASGLPSWASFLIVAGVFLAIGAIVTKTMPKGAKKMDLVPEKEMGKVERDARWMASTAKNAVKQ